MININDQKYQLGRKLYDAQVIFACVEKGEAIDPEEIKTLANDFVCLLI